jgi:hypothetical protein
MSETKKTNWKPIDSAPRDGSTVFGGNSKTGWTGDVRHDGEWKDTRRGEKAEPDYWQKDDPRKTK